MKILTNLACLFILIFVNLESIYGFFETPGDSLGSSSDWLILPLLVKNKLTHANGLIINGHIDGRDHLQVNNSDYVKTPEKVLDLPVLDPLSLSSMWLLTNEPSDFINATLNRVFVTGLGTFKVKDVASNDLTKSLSILLQFPGLKVTGDYEISHHAHQPFLPAQSAGRVSNDSGSFSIKIPNWYTSWFANVINYSLINSTLTIVNPWCKSYHDSVIPQFTSNSTSYQCDSLCYKAFNSIALMIVNRVTSEIDSHLLKLMSLLIKEEKPIDWVHQYNLALSHHFNQDRRLSSSSNNDIVNHMEESHSRSKRQVPCKPGKELDEYVDSLFRFAARIIRVMEPFSTPNATIYLPEYNIKVFLYDGGATRAYSLQRRKSAWVHCSNESVSLGLTVGFENLRIRYKYRAIHDWKLLWDGDFEADLQDTKMQVQFTQTTPKGEEDSQVQQRVDRLRIWRLGKVRLIIRGLGNLTQGVGLWLSQYLNDPYNQKHLNPTLRRLEVEAVSMINVMLKNFTVPFFTII